MGFVYLWIGIRDNGKLGVVTLRPSAYQEALKAGTFGPTDLVIFVHGDNLSIKEVKLKRSYTIEKDQLYKE
jgi:hypothetical protein